MRITNPTLMRGYTRDYHKLLGAKNKIEHKITSTRDFTRASQNPLSAAKALNVRKSYYYSDQHKENLKVASKFYTEAETSLLQVSDELAGIRETIIAAVNTTKSNEEWLIYAQQLETKAQELCAIFNTDSAGRAIFGGESDNGLPFTIIKDATGHAATVLYHGVPVNALSDYNQFPYSNDVYIDIGLGMYTDQKSHDTDPQSVLRTSFNGAKITGCGAQWGVADIDLSSVKDNRTYCLDVFAGNVKKTIEFKYDPDEATAGTFVDQFNAALKEAYKKEIAYGRDYPEMDSRGVVSLKDANGNPVEGGIVCIVNNETKNPNASSLAIDNDSGYTDNFRLNLGLLTEGKTYTVDVTVNGVRKAITFEAGTSNLSDTDNPVYAEDITVKNFQAALDEAFGFDSKGNSIVHISDTDPTKGVITTEGYPVIVNEHITDDDEAEENTVGTVLVSPSTKSDKINLNRLEEGKTYAININGQRVEFEAGADTAATLQKINDAMHDIAALADYTINETGIVKDGNGDDATLSTVSAGALDEGVEAATIGSWYNYQLEDIGSLFPGDYSLKFIVGNDMQNINFTVNEGDDADAIVASINNELAKYFGGSVKIELDGEGNGQVVTTGTKAVSVVSNGSPATGTEEVFKREAIYSNNYIQLTLDAARALREGDIEYANGCIDRIVSAGEKLLVEIADMGCNEEFIDFNINRITTRQENLAERQNDLEFIDPAEQITLWKSYEALYNAILQMSSSVVPQSIFNYMS